MKALVYYMAGKDFQTVSELHAKYNYDKILMIDKQMDDKYKNDIRALFHTYFGSLEEKENSFNYTQKNTEITYMFNFDLFSECNQTELKTYLHSLSFYTSFIHTDRNGRQLNLIGKYLENCDVDYVIHKSIAPIEYFQWKGRIIEYTTGISIRDFSELGLEVINPKDILKNNNTI
jgi:hypothetical protein